MDNSRVCHCLLFHEHGKQNFVQPFCLSTKLLCYTHAWTKLHNEVMSWISGAIYTSKVSLWHRPLPSIFAHTQLLCYDLYGTYIIGASLPWALSCICSRLHFIDACVVYVCVRVAIYRKFKFSEQCCKFETLFAQFKFSVYSHTHADIHYTRVEAMQSTANAWWGSGQACPNNICNV